MLNIIETIQNYFTRKLLPDYLSSEVALYFNVEAVVAIYLVTVNLDHISPVRFGD